MPSGSQFPPMGLKLPPSQSMPPTLPGLDPSSPSVVLGENGLVTEQTTDGEWSYDPNEPRYCICNQVSYGDMVACDNEAVIHCPMLDVSISDRLSFFAVPLRMVPLPVRRHHAVAQRQMVLPQMYCFYEETGNSKINSFLLLTIYKQTNEFKLLNEDKYFFLRF